MPRTRSQGEPLDKSTDEPERILSVRRAVKDYCLNHTIPLPKPEIKIDSETDSNSSSETETSPEVDMAEEQRTRPLKEYAAPSQQEPHNCIAAPAINRNDFELKPSLISAIQQRQFFGDPSEFIYLFTGITVVNSNQ